MADVLERLEKWALAAAAEHATGLVAVLREAAAEIRRLRRDGR